MLKAIHLGLLLLLFAPGDSSAVADKLKSGVSEVVGYAFAFAALKKDGSVVVWGNPKAGGNSFDVAHKLTSGVKKIASNMFAFAALKEDGSVVTWGNSNSGGDATEVARHIHKGVKDVFRLTDRAFVALKEDGSVITWGSAEKLARLWLSTTKRLSATNSYAWKSSGHAQLKKNGCKRQNLTTR